MEFGHVRGRDGYYHKEDRDQDQEQEDSSSNKHHPAGLSPSPSSEAAFAEKEHMFDKVVTPSDVGKLNRLVIPKQHAERHFPLDPSSSEKGLLLNFEDPSGKTWRFRYSYWNSSQSYVMTKGWSRFVKEKRLDAGDTVSFSRGVVVGEYSNSNTTHDLFIDWKRRPEVLVSAPRSAPYSSSDYYPMVSSFSRPWGGSTRLLVPNDPNASAYNSVSHTEVSSGSGQYRVFRSAPPAQVLDATLAVPMVLHSVPVAKRVRLFGVNLDFQESDRNAAGTQSIFSSSSSSSSPSPCE